jgi:NitT/TauT family transport system permease protein
MNALLNIIKNFPRYLWSGWGAMASIFLFIALWEFGHQSYGELILPAPKDTFLRLLNMLVHEGMWQEIQITVKRALWGFLISAVLGSGMGLLAGLFATASMMSRPIVTILMGMPPIAWIVLAMIWFGMGDTTVIFTVVVASFPIVFVGALQGTRTLENHHEEMADSFKTPLLMKFSDIYFPHVFSYFFPAWIAALGMSWKIVVMAELLSTSDGIGASLAVTRSQLDTNGALALVLMLVGSLLLIEYLLMEPIKREVEQWRD